MIGGLSLIPMVGLMKWWTNNWLQTQVISNGFLTTKGCEKSRQTVQDVLLKFLMPLNHNAAISQLGFGFWRYLFASKEFRSANSTLLRIFPNRPIGKGINQAVIFDKLSDLNRIRNRIAHHESICFSYNKTLSDRYTRHDFDIIIELLQWMNYDPNLMLNDLYDFDKEAVYLLSI